VAGITEEERQAVALRRDGFTVLPDLVSADRVAEIMALLDRDYPAYVGRDTQPPDTFKVGHRRYNAPLTFGGPFALRDVLLAPALVALANATLGPHWVFEAYGAIYSLSGARPQPAHRDGATLFPETGIDRVLPAAALTFVLPLVECDSGAGRTALYPGTQRFDEPGPDDEPVVPRPPLGSALIWDFRIRHYGEANDSSLARPMIYATLCRPFWIDHRNFVPGRTAKLLARCEALASLPEDERCRFVRAELAPEG
jgi:hypothetical protein